MKSKNRIFWGLIICMVLVSFINKDNLVTAKETSNNICTWNYKVDKSQNIVFLGDSITDWYPIEDFFDDIPIVNSGHAGDNTEKILDAITERVYVYNPTKVFIQIGTNDIKNENIDNDDIANNINKMIKGIKKKRSKAKIYVLSIYPVNSRNNEKINRDNVLPRTNEEIQRVNSQIKDVCKEQKVTYIDIYSKLVADDGDLNLRYTRDGLHLNDIGYYKVTKALLPYVVS